MKTEMPCYKIFENSSKYKVAIHDSSGQHISGRTELKNGKLEISIIGSNGENVLILLPQGMEKRIALIKESYLN